MSARSKLATNTGKRSIEECIDSDINTSEPAKKKARIDRDDINNDNKKIFAIFICGPDPTQNVEDENASNVRGKTYIDLLKRDDDDDMDNNDNLEEEWKEYLIYKNQFPCSNEEICRFSGIVITGSKHDAFTDDVEWKNKLQEIIRFIYYNKKTIKLLGICFGHQIIIHSLRYQLEHKNNHKMDDKMDNKMYVGRNNKKKEMELGLISIDLTDKFYSFCNSFNIEIDAKSLTIHQAHNDAVFELPSHLIDGEVLASSKYTDIEMYRIGHYILGLQGHPEFTTNYLLNGIKQNQKSIKLTNNELHEKIIKMKQKTASINEWKYILKTWFKV